MNVSFLPHVNASLNALAAGLLTAGYFFIRRKNVPAHRRCMVGAFSASVLFLACYVTYHAARQAQEGVGHTKFTGPPAAAKVYYALLITHVVLAAAVPFLAVATLIRAVRGDFARHRRIARWTWPIWMYVSITGVLVYLLLYHVYPAPRPPA